MQAEEIMEKFSINADATVETSKYISFNGETGTVREFADKYGLAYSCLYERLKLGWSIEKALLTPSRKVVKV